MKYTLRIKKNKIFRYVFKNGEFSKGKFVIIHINKRKQEDENCNYFAVCVSKKNGKSVQRNKLKRWVREVYKQEEEKLKRGYNIIISYKKSTTVDITSYEKVRNDIIKCFKDLRLYDSI